MDASIGHSNGQNGALKPTDISRLRTDILRGYDALSRERFGALNERQRRRMREVAQAVKYLNTAIEEYEQYASLPTHLRPFDPRYRVMYTARLPLEMILQCTYFMTVNLMRDASSLNADQREAVWLMERSARRLVLEIERLWAAMAAEQAAPQT